MSKNKKVNDIEVVEPKEVAKEPSKNWQSFKVLKQFVTSKTTYESGHTLVHYDKKVIDFLKTNKII